MRPTKAQFKEWGKQGGFKRAAALSPRRRKEIARKAVAVREARKNGGAK